MLLRYYFELITGLIVIAVVIISGKVIGSTAFVLLAFLPLLKRIKKGKVDERELYVFYKAGNLTMGLSVFCLYFINRFGDKTINEQTIGDIWFPLSIGSILVVHGLSGVIMNRS